MRNDLVSWKRYAITAGAIALIAAGCATNDEGLDITGPYAAAPSGGPSSSPAAAAGATGAAATGGAGGSAPSAGQGASTPDGGGGVPPATGGPSPSPGLDAGTPPQSTDQQRPDGGARDAARAPADSEAMPPPPASGAAVQQLCVDTINKYRATLGLAPYARLAEKEPCADGQAKSDSMGGSAHGAFGKCSESAQNECPGLPGTDADALVKCLAQMWAEGPPGSGGGQHGHYVNMTNTRYKQAFCGFYKTSTGRWWIVQDFR